MSLGELARRRRSSDCSCSCSPLELSSIPDRPLLRVLREYVVRVSLVDYVTVSCRLVGASMSSEIDTTVQDRWWKRKRNCENGEFIKKKKKKNKKLRFLNANTSMAFAASRFTSRSFVYVLRERVYIYIQ